MNRGLALLAFAFPLAAQLPVSHPLFENDAVHQFHLTFDSPAWFDQLRANFEGLDDPVYMEATFTWNDTVMERVGVRLKGNSSYRTYPGNKKSFKIKTNEFIKGRRINGIDTLNLHNAFKDPAYVREKIYYEMAARAGLAAPRCNYAALYINGEYWGLYFLTEDVDSSFLENHIGAKEDGNFYKGDPRGTLEWRGPDAAPYRQDYEKQNHTSADDWSDLIQLIDALNRTPREQLEDRLPALLDIDSALTLLALDNITANLDSYIGSGHNYYLYHRRSDGKFQFIPWDPNEAFGNFNMGLTINDLQRLPLDWLPRPGPPPPGQPPPPANATVPRPLAQRLWEVPAFRKAYLAKVRSLLDDAAQPDALLSRMVELRNLVRPYVERETRSMFTLEQFDRAMSENQRITVAPQGPPPPGPPQGPPQAPPQPPPGPGAPPQVPVFDIPGLDPFVRARIASLIRQLE